MIIRKYPTQSGALVSMARVCMGLDGCAHVSGRTSLSTSDMPPRVKTTYNVNPQAWQALNELNPRTNKQDASTHALNKLQPTRPPRAVSQ